MANIPVVSFAPFLQGNEQERRLVAKQVYEAFSTVGFIYLKDHGVSGASVEQVFNESKRFFSLPLDQKLKWRLSDASINQGYTADGAEGVNDHKECYEHRRFRNELCPNDAELKDFKTNIDSFYNNCLTLALNILKCLAIMMNLEEDYFDRITTRADPQLRLLHYPAIPRSEVDRPGHSRIGAHSDFGLCTLLFQDNIGGLQIDPFHTGEFKAAPPIPDTVLVNIGDLCQRLTNGRMKSTMHRVVSPQVAGDMLPDRYSIPFFVHPDPETVIDPITLEPGEPKLYKAVRAGEWRNYNTRRNYGFEGVERTGLGRVDGEEARVALS